MAEGRDLVNETQNGDIYKKSNEEKLNYLITELGKLNSSVKKLNDNVEGLAQDVARIDETATKNSNDIKKHKQILDGLTTKTSNNSGDILNFKKNFEDLNKSLSAARSEINDLEQYGRRMMLKISGVPKINDEDTDQIVLQLAKNLGVQLADTDLDISHRTSNHADAPIIVKFDSQRARDRFYQARKTIKNRKLTSKDLGFKQGQRIYINESLTQRNGDLYQYARTKLLKTDRYQFVWTSNGTVKAKETDSKDTRTIIINSTEQINTLFHNTMPKNFPKAN